MAEDSKAVEILSRFESMKSSASNWRSLWDDSARYVCPHRGGIQTQHSDGEEIGNDLFDSTAEESLGIFAAGILSQLTPPGEMWGRFEPDMGEQGAANDTVAQWFGECTDIVLKALYSSNFYLAWHEALLDAGTFGTFGINLDERPENDTAAPLLNFTALSHGSYYIEENHRGLVDTICREWKWTARQAEQEFGKEALTEKIRETLASSNAEAQAKQFTFVQLITPRRPGEWKPGQVAAELRPIASTIVCVEDKQVISVGGYYEMPIAVCRMEKARGERWGRGPAQKVLPEVRMVNRMERDILLAAERLANPGWIMPEDAAYKPDNRPGGITYWDATNSANEPKQIENTAQIDLAEMKTEQKRRRIREGFYVSMFQMLSNAAEAQREKTAFEVAQMVQEKLNLFSPIFSRIVNEGLNPLLIRTFQICARAGRFPTPPQEIQDFFGYRIEYTSKIALAIKAAQTQALVDVMQIIQAMTPFDQRVALVVDWVAEARKVAQNRGVTAENIRSIAEVEQLGEEMAKAQQAMQQAQTAELTTRAAKNLGPRAQDAAASAAGA